MLLGKDQILTRRALPSEEVEVPEWQGSVRIQGLSAGEADAFSASLVKRNGKTVEMDREHYCAKLLCRCIVDAGGERILSESDVAILSQQSAAPIQRLAVIAERLSGLQPGGVEDAAKNLGSGLTNTACIGSPPNSASGISKDSGR